MTFRLPRWLKRLLPKAAKRPPRRPLDLSVGTLSAAEREFLRALVQRASSYEGPIIEIGTLFGVTAIDIALAKAPERPLIAVDNFSWNPFGLSRDEHFQLTRHVLRYASLTVNVTVQVSCKNEFYRTYDGARPSLVFLDAIHSYEETRRDIAWARSIQAPIVAGHDYCPEFPGVIQAVDEVGGPRELVETLWVL
jgi:predicted O-methyltransferase YrrM